MRTGMKRFFITLTASLVLVSTTALAEDNTARDQVPGKLSQAAADSQAIVDDIKSGASPGEIQKKVDALPTIDLGDLGIGEEGSSAPMSGSLYQLGGSGGSAQSGSNISQEFARLQLELANSNKNLMSAQMDKIAKLQNETKNINVYMNQARQIRNQAYDLETKTNMSQAAKAQLKKNCVMPPNMKYYLDENKIPYPKAPAGGVYTSAQWDIIAGNLESRLDSLGTQIQQLMVKIQDALGKYNSSLQGASSSIGGMNQPLQGLKKGQSLFSVQGGAVNTAPIATSVILGVLAGMLLMWGILKKKGQGTLPGNQP